jgi:benzoyl-CoA reductase/2-hydroxyglutaryl-CoA dehydratase subunit BcrC/BadD/HgdB
MRKSLVKYLEISEQYYQIFEKKKAPLAWVSTFVPIEILEAMGIYYIFPESYAAVIAASGKESDYISHSMQMCLDRSLCSYSTAFNGSYFKREGPKGVPGKPDVLIASNNQCGTLPGWWNYLAKKLDVPLFILDYPGELSFDSSTRDYIAGQHEHLINFLQSCTSCTFSEEKIQLAIRNSKKSIMAWKRVLNLRETYFISPQITFDYIFPLITRRCDENTVAFYTYLYVDLIKSLSKTVNEKRIFWVGYPLWHKGKRYMVPKNFNEIKVVLDDYSSWWNLDYRGKTWREVLVKAYNFTILNRTLEYRSNWICDMVKKYKIDGIIFNMNKSCKRAKGLDTALKRWLDIPSVIINTDMIDRSFFFKPTLNIRLETFMEALGYGFGY